MRAKYIGHDGKMTFETGKIYEITTKCGIMSFPVSGTRECALFVYDRRSYAHCPYSGLETFLQDWELL